MDIRIETITLHNFKGIRDLTVPLGGHNAEIAGRNGAGKSSIFDAFTWLLFGKDHNGLDWTNFDIKPIDPATGEAIHHLDHWVEADLTIDGTHRILRREIAENWVKPRGQAETVMQGHSQSFYIDGVTCSAKRDFDTAVAQWIDEAIFRIVTNPLHLIDDKYTGWKERRKHVLSLVDGVDVDKVRSSYADVLAEIKGTPLEQFRKKLAADKKANKTKLAEASANIKAWKNALPPEVDLEGDKAEKDRIAAATEEAVAKVKSQIADIDAKVLNANEANKARKEKIDAIWKEIYNVRDKMRDMLDDERSARKDAYDAEVKALDDKRREMTKYEQDVRLNNELITSEQAHISSLEAKIQKEADDLANLGVRFEDIRTKAFDTPDACPTCGQKLPEQMLEAKRKQLAADRAAELEGIKQEGATIKTRVAEYRKLKEKSLALIAGYKEARDAAFKKAEETDAAIGNMARITEPDYAAVEAAVKASQPYLALVEEESRLTAEADDMAGDSTDGTAELLAKRHTLEDEIERMRRESDEQLQPIRAREAIDGERRRLLGMIEDEGQREKGLADEVARLERLEARTGDMVMATINAQTEAVNGLFKVARWKMFDTTLDGNPEEMCEVTDIQGVPYRSMNDAMKILCGMDVIRAFAKRSNHTAPIFIDNAESVLQNSFDTDAQVIRLVVADQDLTIDQQTTQTWSR